LYLVTHSIKTKYGVIIEMFDKKYVVLCIIIDDYSFIKHQEIIDIDFLTKNNFAFSNKSLTLERKKFKRCDKSHPSSANKNSTILVIQG